MLNRLKQFLAPIRCWKELPLRPMGDRPATTTAPASKIPPVVIQTWEDVSSANPTCVRWSISAP